MDPHSLPVSQDISTGNSSQGKSFLKNKYVLIAIVGVAVVCMIGVIALSFLPPKKVITQSSPSPNPQKPTQSQKNSYTIYYGLWANNSTILKSYDMGTGMTSTLAQLPFKIKKITVLSPGQLLFINNTDSTDRGNEIDEYSVSTHTITPILTADSSFGIDDYQISENHTYLADWEVQNNPSDPNVLLGGSSKVYGVSLKSPSSKNLLYSEQATASGVHYPVGVTNTGQVVCDTFIPNSVIGWSHGMSTVSIDGKTKQQISYLSNGAYISQPEFSPTTESFLFSVPLSQANTPTSGANYGDNTLVLFSPDKSTLTHILPSTPGIKYANPFFDLADPQSILYVKISNGDAGIYLYNTETKKETHLSLSPTMIQEDSVLGVFPSGDILLTHKNQSATTLGNLGSSYAYLNSQIFIYSPKTGNVTNMPIEDLSQIISITPNTTASATSVNTAPFGSPPTTVTPTLTQAVNENNSLMISSFEIKPSLAPIRDVQQSTPPVNIENNNTQTNNPGLNYQQNNNIGNILLPQNNPDSYSQCVADHENGYCKGDNSCINALNALSTAGCYDSPLYLYGQNGLHVTVHIGVPVFESFPLSQNGAYSVTLSGKDQVKIGGTIADSITYRYTPGAHFPAPEYGAVVEREKSNVVIQDYAQKLGFNKKETTDLEKFAQDNLTAPYVFISFYSQEQSKKILPIEFSPTPDVYENVVFYFKEYNSKPDFIPYSPIFPLLSARYGFTAVEISEQLIPVD